MNNQNGEKTIDVARIDGLATKARAIADLVGSVDVEQLSDNSLQVVMMVQEGYLKEIIDSVDAANSYT